MFSLLLRCKSYTVLISRQQQIDTFSHSVLSVCVSDGYIRTTISWPNEDLVAAMDAQAKRERRTRSNFVLNAVWEYLRTRNALPQAMLDSDGGPDVNSAPGHDAGHEQEHEARYRKAVAAGRETVAPRHRLGASSHHRSTAKPA